MFKKMISSQAIQDIHSLLRKYVLDRNQERENGFSLRRQANTYNRGVCYFRCGSPYGERETLSRALLCSRS